MMIIYVANSIGGKGKGVRKRLLVTEETVKDVE
jgi:hypothetical protein